MRTPQQPVTLSDEVKTLIDEGCEGEAGELLKKQHPWLDTGDLLQVIFNYRFRDRNTASDSLPGEVQEALAAGHKIEAIKRLREARQLGLKEAKDIIDNHDVTAGTGVLARATPAGPGREVLATVLGFACLASFVWMMVRIFIVVGSIIILFNLDDYRQAEFTVTDIYYRSDNEGGTTWWITGTIAGDEVRLADDRLVSDKDNTIGELRRRYPLGDILPVWYNPAVTDELFQNRTLDVTPWTDDPAAYEQSRLWDWFLTGFLPFLCLYLAWLARQKSVTTIPRPQ